MVSQEYVLGLAVVVIFIATQAVAAAAGPEVALPATTNQLTSTEYVLTTAEGVSVSNGEANLIFEADSARRLAEVDHDASNIPGNTRLAIRWAYGDDARYFTVVRVGPRGETEGLEACPRVSSDILQARLDLQEVERIGEEWLIGNER